VLAERLLVSNTMNALVIGDGTFSDADGREIGTAGYRDHLWKQGSVLLSAGGAQIGAMRPEKGLKHGLRISDASGSNVGTVTEHKDGKYWSRWALELEQSVSEPLRSIAIAASFCRHGLLTRGTSSSAFSTFGP
jgi:hypothetical protein